MTCVYARLKSHKRSDTRGHTVFKLLQNGRDISTKSKGERERESEGILYRVY